ncbi:MAG: alpha/beta hydrolase [Okeania sp. SIO2C2]|uniref:alpha/beta hydrolase n=1 Tax=Okeania sp. SIO2C2 TaxID=2607787 RepID=UPI0013B913EB|nr:alpha/beta hydrolase [Okeania sp. SIO2C2]NEP86428.1 alpha/beta hydrolase [Okeania sp. SIO2C2]
MWQFHYFLVAKLILIVGIVLAIAYVAVCIFLVFLQQRFMFFPSSVIKITPKDVNLSYEDVWLSASKKKGKLEQIHGWWIPANSEVSNFQGVLLYLHGNGINIGANVEQAYRFQKLGFDVLLIDYRGYGRSKGNFPSEAQIYQDVEIVWNYLVNQREINPQNILVYGHSLGGAIAIELAIRHPKMAGLIIQSSFTSMQGMVDYRGRMYRFFPIKLILHQIFDSITKLRKLDIPIMLIHGREDGSVPAYMSEKLFAVTPAKIKDLYIVPGADHNDVAAIAGDEYLERLNKFINRLKKKQKQSIEQ